MNYVCCDETACEETELFDVLQEMDRRYYLLQHFRWEFTLLDLNKVDSIPESSARWLVKTAHGKYFSRSKWEQFLRQRAVPGSNVSFSEIEVMLCNIPSIEDIFEENKNELQAKENERKKQEMIQILELEKEKQKNIKEEEQILKKLSVIENEEQRLLEEEREIALKEAEKQETIRRQKLLDNEKERGKLEADLREKELQEAEQQELIERQKELEREQLRIKEQAEAKDAFLLLQDAKEEENKLLDELKRLKLEQQTAKDGTVRAEIEESSKLAQLRANELRNKIIRYNLEVAVKTPDFVKLPLAIEEFKNAKLPDDDGDLEKGERLLKLIMVKEGLNNALSSRKLHNLEQAINQAKRYGFEYELKSELIEANKILLQLRRLERIRAEILELKQSTVAEIRSYQKPPPVVHKVMIGTFLVLGYKEKETKVWKTMQALVGKTGKEGLKRQCLDCDPEQIKEDYARRCKELFEEVELDDVRDVSAAAATFFIWSITMIEEAEARAESKKNNNLTSVAPETKADSDLNLKIKTLNATPSKQSIEKVEKVHVKTVKKVTSTQMKRVEK